MDNINKLQKNESESNKVGKGQDPVAVEKFGFPVATCCGFIPQNNEWHDDWVVSVARYIQCTSIKSAHNPKIFFWLK